jgi:eukaryotic-like serine/threonine-protein kinase
MTKPFSLSAVLKKQKTLVTDLGEFEYVKQIGEGGNSLVFLFEKSAQSFAVKFLKLSEATKENRFKDEYFCSMQMASHKNVVELYHFDKVVVCSTDYFVIFMKHYEGVLKGPLIGKTDKEKAECGWKLFEDLSAALAHLHKHRVIHRDIKPQNIFVSQSNQFVLGDLGIAHFPDELFPKLSKTANSDRMANFMFSAPEQSEVGSNVTEAADIYSLGQVLQWYLSGKTVRGTGRTSIGTSTSPEELKTLDAVINKCMRNNSAERFQSIAEIVKFIKEKRSPKKKDPWEEIHNFDDAIRKSFTTIGDYYESSAQNEITDFVSNFQQSCSPESFYWVGSDGGSFHYCPMRQLSDGYLMKKN